MSNIIIHRIMIAVDYGRSSECALRTGARLALDLGATVALLHVVRPPVPYGPEVMAVSAEAREDALRRGRILLREMCEEISPHVSVTEMLDEGIPEDFIVERAADWQADLIVIGDHNRSRLASLFLGSTAEQIVRRAPCPVLVARPKTGPFIKDNESAEVAIAEPAGASEGVSTLN